MGIANLKLILLCFDNMSGLKINFHKSEVVMMGVTKPKELCIATILIAN
jgi:hypothetical protein